jgi:hypothetical protein
MNEQEHADKDAAIKAAIRAVKPMRTAAVLARQSITQAKADLAHTGFEITKLWMETYSRVLKERRAARKKRGW